MTVVQLKSDDFAMSDDDFIKKMQAKLIREGTASRLFGMSITRDEAKKTVTVTANLYPEEE